MQIGFHLLTQEDHLLAHLTIGQSPPMHFPIYCLLAAAYQCSHFLHTQHQILVLLSQFAEGVYQHSHPLVLSQVNLLILHTLQSHFLSYH